MDKEAFDMNTKPLVSILVPVYKVEAYLQRCIDSVLAQDFQDWEMILVDDGSPDRCPEICDEAARKDDRIRVVHKENGGLPSARLAGFEQAKGTYLIFLDSDDWLMPNTLITLYHYIQSGEYDIVRGCNRRVYVDGTYIIEKSRTIGEISGMEECLNAVIRHSLLPYLWGAIYRRELFSNKIFEKILNFSTGEDWLTNIAVAKKVNKILSINDVVYNYYININSMMQAQVCSHAYGVRLQSCLAELTEDCSEKIKFAVILNKTQGCISDLFIPELPFKEENFSFVREMMKNPHIREYVYKEVNPRFLYFINIPFLYKYYTRFYCFVFKYLKLKGKKRTVKE